MAEIDTLFEKTKGRLFIMKGAGFLGSLLCSLKFTWTDQLPTAGISDDTLYWNPDFFLSLSPDSRVTVLAHELWHNAYMHGFTRGNRDHELWNIAGDHVINLMLKEHGYDMSGFPYYMDPKYRGWSTLDVYEDLQKQNQGKPPLPVQGQKAGLPMADILPPENPSPAAAAKAKSAAIGRVSAAAAMARITGKAGDIPGEVQLTLDGFLNPKLPWEVLLMNYFNELSTVDRSFRSPSRRSSAEFILPGNTGRNGLDHLIFFEDISGSVSDADILRFNSEAAAVKDRLDPEKMTLVTFDTRIQDVLELEREDDFRRIRVTGRGGTCLKPVMAYAKKHVPTAIVIFSDLHVSIPPDPGIPVLWVCIGNPEAKPPYGRIIHIEEEPAA